MGLIEDDSRGQVFSLDILIALIPLTIILGMVGADMDNMLYLTQDTVFQSSTERVAADAASALIETSGTPPDWEQSGDLKVVGLAKYDNNMNMSMENYLSPHKLNALNEDNMQELIGPNYGFYLKISRADDKSILVRNPIGTYNDSAKNVVKVERLVTTSGLQVETSLEGLVRATGKPKTYETDFATNKIYVESYDYWILVNNSGYNSAIITVNGNTVVGHDEIKQDVPELKKWINDTYLKNETNFLDNLVSVTAASNPGNKMDVYVISAPKGTPESEISLDNIKLRNCMFELYVWVK